MTINRREVLTAGCFGLFAVGMGSFVKITLAQPSGLPAKLYVDVHRHLLPPEFGGDPEKDLDKTLAWMDRYGVMQAVLLGAFDVVPARKADFGQAQASLSRIMSRSDRFFPFCTVHPDTIYSQSELVGVLEQLKKFGIKGMGEFKQKGLHIDDPKCMMIYAACAEAGLPVLVHTDDSHCIDDPGLPGLENVLKAFTDLTFIAHGPGWWASISGDVTTREALNMRPKTKVVPGGAVQRLLDAYPKLVADLSASSGLNAISRDPDYGPDFLVNYQDRLLFGTDTAPEPAPEAMPQQFPEFVRKGLFDNWGHFEFFPQIDIPPEVAHKIYQGNARRILNLPVPEDPNRRLSGL